MTQDLVSLAVIAGIAALTPLAISLLRIKLPEVVLLIVLGAVFGQQLVGWIDVTSAVSLFSELGLGLLFFIAGYEVDLKRLPRESLRLASIGWLISVVLACGAAALLLYSGDVIAFAPVAIALTSTALGTLLPILEDRGLAHGRFGQFFFGAGFLGEFGPILAISIVLSRYSSFVSLIILAGFALFVLLVAVLPARLASDQIRRVLATTSTGNSMSDLRLTLLLMLALLALASSFGLDAVIGAFAAGAVLRLYTPERNHQLMTRIEAVSFGLFIPLFFIVSGANLDLDAVVANPMQLIGFFLLMGLVRGVPTWFVYRNAMPDVQERAGFALYVSTGLPILVAVTTVAVAEGIMRPQKAAILVSAGVLSVIVYPALAALVMRNDPLPVAETKGGDEPYFLDDEGLGL